MRRYGVLVFLSAWPALALAQPEHIREHVDSVRAALTEYQDTLALLELEQRRIEDATEHRDSALLHMELGFIAFRIGELTDNNFHYDNAAGEFEWAAELEPTWGYPFYGLGLAEHAMGQHSIIAVQNIREALGVDNISKAVGALEQSVLADPGYVPALEMLWDLALQKRFRQHLERVHMAFNRAMGTRARDDPDLYLAHGRFLREVGLYDGAAIAFRRYLSRGGDRSLGSLELARIELGLGDSAQGRPRYYAAAANADEAVMKEFRRDVFWVADSLELAEFDQLTPEQLEPWVRSFWERRALMEFRRPGERVTEHFRRYLWAKEHTTRPMPRRRVEYGVLFQRRTDEVSAIGEIYLRHGNPQVNVEFINEQGEAAYSWLYRIGGERYLVHFYPRDQFGNYAVVGSVGSNADYSYALREVDELYSRLSRQTGNSPSYLAAERSLVRRSIDTLTSTDSYSLRFERELEPTVRVYTLSGEQPSGRAVVAAALPFDNIPSRPSRTGPGSARTLMVRSVGIGPGRHVVDLLDTVRVFRDEGRDDEMLLLAVELPLLPEAPTIRMLYADPELRAGGIVEAGPLEIPSTDAGDYNLSSMVVGSERTGARWEELDFPINPLGRYNPNDTLQIYYEVLGVPEGQTYEVSIELRKTGGGVFGFIGRALGGGFEVELEFTDVSNGTVSRSVQQLAFGEPGDGEYELKLRVRFPDGERIERKERIEIRESYE